MRGSTAAESDSGAHRATRRFLPLVWLAGLVAAALLVLGVNGTLSSWTDAIINNTNNTVASAAAVSLLETGPDGTTTCDTAAVADGSNTVQCSTINKYGGIGDANAATDGRNATDAGGTRLSPDSATVNSQTVTITMQNTGTESGALTLTPAACGNSAYPGETLTSGNLTNYDLCSQMQLTLACAGGLTADYTYTAGATPATLAQFNSDGKQAVGALPAGATTACTFTVTLPLKTPAGYASQVASQQLKWELTAA